MTHRKGIVYEGKSTYFCISCVDGTGEKCMLVCLDDTTTQPRAEDIDYDFLREGEFVHMIGTYEDLVLSVARHSKEKGFKLSLDIERQNRVIPAEKIEEILSLSYITFPNENGARYFTGEDDIEKAADKMLGLGCEIVVVTLGAKGVYVCTKGERFTVPAFKVDVVDTTGAGDTFNASFLSCVAKGYDLKKCAHLATAAAALQIQQAGARPGMADEAAAQAFLKSRGIMV